MNSNNVHPRIFSWANESIQVFWVDFVAMDYIFSLETEQWSSFITIRWAEWGGFMNGNGKSITYFRKTLGQFLLRHKPFKRNKEFNRLHTDPIVLRDDHDYCAWTNQSNCIIFQKWNLNGSDILKIRCISWVQNILSQNLVVTICNPHELFQKDLFKEDSPLDIINPLFASPKEFDEIAKVLLSIWRVQQKFYQKQVDELLSILPPS